MEIFVQLHRHYLAVNTMPSVTCYFLTDMFYITLMKLVAVLFLHNLTYNIFYSLMEKYVNEK